LGVYEDRNISGTTYPAGFEDYGEADEDWQEYLKTNRHAAANPYRAGLGDALKRTADYLIVDDTTRIMRPPLDGIMRSVVIKTLKKHFQKILTTQEGDVDYNNFSSRFAQAVKDMILQEDKEIKRKKALRGLHEAINQGKLIGRNVSYGYDFVKSQTVAINSKCAETVKKIYADYTESQNAHKITQTLNHNKVKYPPKYGNKWHARIVWNILRNPHYIGMTWNADKTEIIKSAVYPPIIEPAVWHKARHIIKSRPRFEKTHTYTHPLSGKVFCGACNSYMLASPGNFDTHRYIMCSDYRRYFRAERNKDCTLTRVNETNKLKQDLSALNVYGIVDALAPLSLLSYRKISAEKVALTSSGKERISLEEDLAKSERNFGAVQEKFGLNEIEPAEYFKLQSIFLKRIKETKSQISAILAGETEVNSKILLERTTLQQKITAQDYTLEELKLMLPEVISKIIIYPYRVQAVLYDGTSFELERVAVCSARSLPAWSLSISPRSHRYTLSYYYKSWYSDSTRIRQDPETGNIEYDAGHQPVQTIYDTPALKIVTVGANPPPKRYVLGVGYVEQSR
jgi:DNA invertase Pin-like site-specific DNA recombinase